MMIKGHGVILRDDRRDSDADDFFRWLNLEEWKYYDEPDKPFQPISREEFDKLQEKQSHRPSSSQGRAWHIDTVDGQHIGWVSSYNWDQKENCAFIGICIPEEQNWGKGYGTEAVHLFLSFLFDSFDLITIRTATWTGNSRMVRCAKKVGFRNQAIMPHRSSISIRGEPLKRIEFSLTKAEWDQTKKGRD